MDRGNTKQAILEALVQEVMVQYAKHSLFAKADWEKDTDSLPQTSDDAVQMIQVQIHYILHDPAISRARKMLVIEQFQNPELAYFRLDQPLRQRTGAREGSHGSGGQACQIVFQTLSAVRKVT